jgi:hypothetical protein
MPGIAVGVVSNGRPVDLRWAASLPQLQANTPLGMSTAWMFNESDDSTGKKSIGLKREEIAEKAVQCGFEYLQFLDDDTISPAYTLRALHYQLSNNLETMVCGGIYCTREEISQPLVFMKIGGGSFYEWKVGDVFPCAFIGCGSMMIKTKVFEKISKPWFREENDFNDRKTEDAYFCSKVAAAGFKILAHGGVLPGHIGLNRKLHVLPPDSYPLRGVKMEEVTVQLS